MKKAIVAPVMGSTEKEDDGSIWMNLSFCSSLPILNLEFDYLMEYWMTFT